MNKPRILALDIETSPLHVSIWALGKQYVAPRQIKKDWSILAFAAKWVGDPPNKMIYMDQRTIKRGKENDSRLMKKLWQLMSKSDIILTQNGKKFDIKKINSRFVEMGLTKPSAYKQLDTYVINKKYFGFTSYKLEYLAEKLKLKHRKLKHKKYPGEELWDECLKGNQVAWNEMEHYNKQDVLCLEDLYDKIKAWDDSINFNLYYSSLESICKCGSTKFKKKGFAYTSTGKYQRYKCVECGSDARDKKNLLSKDKMSGMKLPIK